MCDSSNNGNNKCEIKGNIDPKIACQIKSAVKNIWGEANSLQFSTNDLQKINNLIDNLERKIPEFPEFTLNILGNKKVHMQKMHEHYYDLNIRSESDRLIEYARFNRSQFLEFAEKINKCVEHVKQYPED